jgi:hypothetical protein
MPGGRHRGRSESHRSESIFSGQLSGQSDPAYVQDWRKQFHVAGIATLQSPRNSPPNLQRKLTDSDDGFAYLGFAEGDYLNQHVNGERTNFSFPTSRDATDEVFDDITLDAIRNGALAGVTADFQPFLQEINTEN